MKPLRLAGLLILLLCAGGGAWYFWRQAEPRRTSLQVLQQFNHALTSGNSAQLLELISLPAGLAARTAAEQSEFLSKALRDEISTEGLAVLQRDGQFGALTNLFAAEAGAWAKQAGVAVEDCVAFKLEKNGVRCEVILLREPLYGDGANAASARFRVIRCNNVKQLAAANF